MQQSLSSEQSLSSLSWEQQSFSEFKSDIREVFARKLDSEISNPCISVQALDMKENRNREQIINLVINQQNNTTTTFESILSPQRFTKKG